MKAAFYTLGCKVNQYETEYMAELLQNAGFEIVEPTSKADYYIVNSCTVTATSNQKTRQNIRKFKQNHPDATVVLTGCMPQAFPDEVSTLTEADIIFSNRDDGDILRIINRHAIEKKRLIEINEHKNGEAFSKCKISQFNGRIRAFVKIEDGCDRFCSYCIIPKARGRVRSKSLDDLKTEVDELAQNGIKEIVLVGINLSAYGKGEEWNLVNAVHICCENPHIKRVRLGSLEPDHITDEMIREFRKEEKFCPQFHLSLQSGCTKTLKNMNRHYTADEYEKLCIKLRQAFENASITTDVMVGFHEETGEDFEESLEFVQKMNFEKVHVFPYSVRVGTAASKKGDSVSKSEKQRRASIMTRETEIIRSNHLEKLIGKTVRVLAESQHGDNLYQGFTKNYVPVKFKSDTCSIGDEVSLTIHSVKDDYCIAE